MIILRGGGGRSLPGMVIMCCLTSVRLEGGGASRTIRGSLFSLALGGICRMIKGGPGGSV